MTTYPKHYCGVFGIFGSAHAAEHTYHGLYALQHRGQEGAGIVSTDGEHFYEHKDMGLVVNVFSEAVLKKLPGHAAVGHNRYSTTGESSLKNTQPLTIASKRGSVAIGHNGNLTNTLRLRAELEADGAVFHTTTDSEVILHLLARGNFSLEEAIRAMTKQVEGAYSLVILTDNALIAVRDPHGFRPLSLGRLDDSWIIASETCAFDILNAKFERDVEPGEIVVIEKSGVRSLKTDTALVPKACCAFERIYFARPDSILDGRSVYNTRIAMGKKLAEEYPIDADIVVPVPDSGNYAALGYAEARKIPFVMAFIRNHYVGRSFIDPKQSGRDRAVNLKLNLIPELVKGKRVIVVDDSIVRGTTSKARVRRVREAGAREVHMLVSCPPHRHSCFYGIDFPDPSKLAATKSSNEEIRQTLGLDSLGYLSETGLVEAIGHNGLCTACFNGKYPVPPESGQ